MVKKRKRREKHTFRRHTRIYYKKNDKGILVCKHPIVTNGQIIQVHINPKTLNYKLINLLKDEIVAKGRGSSLHQIKTKVKYLLRIMGAHFNDELKEKTVLTLAK